MHAEPSEHEQFGSATAIEQAVITTLLTSEDALWTRGEHERAVDGPRGTGAVGRRRDRPPSTTRASSTSSATS
jgi:hypothetical protein